MNDCEIDNLKSELEHEKTCRETASWQNGELEKQIVSMQEELRRGDYPWDSDLDLERENVRHKHLLVTIEQLREQLPILKDRIRNAKNCGPDCKLKHDDLNINLDILTPNRSDKFEIPIELLMEVIKHITDDIARVKDLLEWNGYKIQGDMTELLRTVKRFERLKTDLISTLRSKEWRLDSESKLFVRVNDQKTYLQNELMICQNNISRLQRNNCYWQNGTPRKYDERVLDPRRAPIKKIVFGDRLPPIATK